MRTVWLVVHDPGWEGGMEVRGVYSSREAAEKHRISRTPTGRPSRSQWAHWDGCCEVQEHEVQDE